MADGPVGLRKPELDWNEHDETFGAKRVRIIGGEFSTTIVQGGSVLKAYETHDLDEAGTITYVGMKDSSGNWCLKKITDTSGDLDIVYANVSNNVGTTLYATAWINRATLTYADLDTLTFNVAVEPFSKHFSYSAKTTITAGSTAYFMAITDSLQAVFENFVIKSDKNDIDIEFYEAPTTSANGTLQTTINTDRTSAQTATMLVYAGPTVTNDGTLLYKDGLLGETKAGGADSIVLDWKLDSATKYIFKLTNNGAQTATIIAQFRWNEY